MLDKNIIDNMNELLARESTAKLLRESFAEIKYQRSSRGQYCITIIISLLLGITIGFNKDTISNMKVAVELISGIDLAFIAIVMGAYSIFQALLTDSVIMALIKTDNNLLKVSNKSFLNLVILYLGGIVSNLVLALLGTVISEEWVLFEKQLMNNIAASVLCSCYFVYNILIILEIKNFGLNLYRMFNSYNSQRIIDILDKETDGK